MLCCLKRYPPWSCIKLVSCDGMPVFTINANRTDQSMVIKYKEVRDLHTWMATTQSFELWTDRFKALCIEMTYTPQR